jgi:hypothetical protein
VFTGAKNGLLGLKKWVNIQNIEQILRKNEPNIFSIGPNIQNIEQIPGKNEPNILSIGSNIQNIEQIPGKNEQIFFAANQDFRANKLIPGPATHISRQIGHRNTSILRIPNLNIHRAFGNLATFC